MSNKEITTFDKVFKKRIKTYNISNMDELIDTAIERKMDVKIIEGVLLDRIMITTNGKRLLNSNFRKTKYIIFEPIVINSWISEYQIICTDSEKKADEFYEEWEAYLDSEDC